MGGYALLSDSHGSALVGREGSIDWACLPRFDGPSVFARILGPDAGHWRISPAGITEVERAYLDGTMVLQTVFRTPSGSAALIDAMPFGHSEREHRIGCDAPHAIVRVVKGLEGEVELELEFQPRPEYGLTTPMLLPHPGGLRTRGGPRAYVLSSGIPLEAEDGVARGRFVVRPGVKVAFAMRACSPWEPLEATWTAEEILRRLEETIAAWRWWSRVHEGYRGPYRDMVRHSGRVLQALTYAPTGGVVAAPTTSLPEAIAGTRNWDYRFCWVRDASLTLEALWVAACPDEAREFFDFFVTAAGGQVDGERALQVLYGVGGERHLPEQVLGHLPGYRDSRPVRIGNGAWGQTQLDIYGELLSAADLLADRMGTFDEVTAEFLCDLANAAARRWEEPDQGIWEVRGGPRHFLYSKLMCWVALDRAVRLAPRLRRAAEMPRWSRARDRIREAILDRGWSDRAGAYTQALGSDDLDASALMMPIVGFLPAADPRMRATIGAVAEHLTDEHGLVYRYRSHDGLPGEEGVFGICTYWLVQCWAMLGEIGRARSLFETITGCANDVGLLSEEIDPATGEPLGNFPQAFTHIGLINAAWAIAQAEDRAADSGQAASGSRRDSL
ncbi:MAG: glycoside hydrolase family 15 protein [Acidimicrobiia bacterium]